MPHTPGPWTWLVETKNKAYLYGPNDVICSVHHHTRSAKDFLGEEDARLIAQAPAMYALLKELAELATEIETSIGNVGHYGQMDRQLSWNGKPVIPRLAAVLKAVEGEDAP